jgi:hypothetical protein
MCHFLIFVCIFVLINGPPPVGILSVYERSTGEKIRLSLEGKGNSNASSAYVIRFLWFDLIVIC